MDRMMPPGLGQPPMMGPPPMDPMMGPPPMDPMMMGPPPMDPMMGPPPMDPMMGQAPSPVMQYEPPMEEQGMMDDPMMLLMLMQMLSEEDQVEVGPFYPRWYKPSDYPKPDLQDIETKVEDDKALHSLLNKRIMAEREVLQLRTVGQFVDAEEDSEVQFSDPSQVHDFNLAVTLVAGCDTNFEARSRKESDADAVERKEQTAHAFRERWKRRNVSMYGTDLGYDEAKIAMGTGHLCARFSLDFDAESDEFPIKADLLDPTTCFPTFGGDRGLETMTRLYSQTVAQVIASYETDDIKIRSKLFEKKQKDENGKERDRRMDDLVEVKEFSDRRWYGVSADGIEVFIAEHGFSYVPYVYVISPYGDAGPQSLHSVLTYGTNTKQTLQADIASKGLSYIWATWRAHEQREAILGRMMTELKKTANPPKTFEQDLSVYGETPDVSDQEGARNLLRRGLENEVSPQPKPGFSLVSPVMGATNEAAARGMMPASAYGITSNANESGTAIEGLNEGGRDKLAPWLVMLQRWDAECAELSLKMFRDWGHLLGSDGQRGEFELELLRPDLGEESTFLITPEDLVAVGVKMRAKRTSMRMSNLGPMAQALATWSDKGWLLDEDALEMRGVEDPRAYLRKVEIQAMKKSPEYQKLQILKLLREEGDLEGAALYQKMIQEEGQPPQGGMPPPDMGMDPTAPGGMGTMGGAPPGSGMGPQAPQQTGMGSMGLPSRMGGVMPPSSMEGIP